MIAVGRFCFSLTPSISQGRRICSYFPSLQKNVTERKLGTLPILNWMAGKLGLIILGVFQLKIQPIYATSASIIRKKINLIHLQQNLLRVSHLTINIEYTFSFKPVNYLFSSLPTGGCSLFWPSYTFCYLLPSLSFLRDRSYRTLKHITFILKHTFFSKTLTLF